MTTQADPLREALRRLILEHIVGRDLRLVEGAHNTAEETADAILSAFPALAQSPAPQGEERFWLELREPHCVPELKGPWPHSQTASVLREFMDARPTAKITVITMGHNGPLVQDGPECLSMCDGRSMGRASRHIKSSDAALSAPQGEGLREARDSFAPGERVWIKGEVIDWGSTDENRIVRAGGDRGFWCPTERLATPIPSDRAGREEIAWVVTPKQFGEEASAEWIQDMASVGYIPSTAEQQAFSSGFAAALRQSTSAGIERAAESIKAAAPIPWTLTRANGGVEVTADDGTLVHSTDFGDIPTERGPAFAEQIAARELANAQLMIVAVNALRALSPSASRE